MEDNTVFENDFEPTEAQAAAANPENEVVEGEVITTEAPTVEEDDFFAENAAPEVPAVDPAHIITLVPSSADNKYVESPDGSPVPMLDLITKAGLRFEGAFTCFLNNAEISLTTLVPAGSTVSIVGKVKGGC